MIILDGATDKLRYTTSAAADIRFSRSWVENNAGVPTPAGAPIAAVVTATTNDLIASPGVGKQRIVAGVEGFNAHASQPSDVTIDRYDGANSSPVAKASLLPGEKLICDYAGNWTHLDANGGAYPALTGVVAAQSDQEAASSNSVLVSPASQQWHPSAAKSWGKITVAGGTPTLQVSYNVTSITDTATDQVTVTINADFSSAHYACVVSIEASTTTLSATTTSLICFTRNATLAAGSFVIQACEIDIGAATDPSSWHFVCFGDL